MGGLVSKLTKSGLQDPGGNTTYFPSGDAAMGAANDALAKTSPNVTMAPPTSVSVMPNPVPPAPLENGTPTLGPSDLGIPRLLTSGGGPKFDTSANRAAPKLVKPTFDSMSTDEYGNQKPIAPGLTKLGVLASLLKGGIQGGSDALQSGALDAVPGRSGFGAGWAGAMNMPIFRKQREIQQQQEQAQTERIKATTAQIPLQGELTKAHAGYWESLAGKKDQRTPEDVYMAAVQDAQSRGVDPAADPATSQALDALRQYEKARALAHPEKPVQTHQELMDQRAQEAQALGLTGDEAKFYQVNGKLREGNPDLEARLAEMNANRGLRASEHADHETDVQATRDATAQSRYETRVSQYNTKKNDISQKEQGEYDKLEADFSKKFAKANNADAQDALTKEHEAKKAQIAGRYSQMYNQLGAEPKAPDSAPSQYAIPALRAGRKKGPASTAPPIPAGATMKVPGSDGKLHWSDGKTDLGVVAQ